MWAGRCAWLGFRVLCAFLGCFRGLVMPLTNCRKCGCYIDPALGAFPPGGEHSEHVGTIDDPRAPGDWDDICDHCNYGSTLIVPDIFPEHD